MSRVEVIPDRSDAESLAHALRTVQATLVDGHLSADEIQSLAATVVSDMDTLRSHHARLVRKLPGAEYWGVWQRGRLRVSYSFDGSLTVDVRLPRAQRRLTISVSEDSLIEVADAD